MLHRHKFPSSSVPPRQIIDSPTISLPFSPLVSPAGNQRALRPSGAPSLLQIFRADDPRHQNPVRQRLWLRGRWAAEYLSGSALPAKYPVSPSRDFVSFCGPLIGQAPEPPISKSITKSITGNRTGSSVRSGRYETAA